MASRGALGGLSEATLQAVLLMDAAGKEDVLIETVGVGQAEIDIIDHADTIVLVLMPGSGDSVQALKAGIMEIPDVIVVNKANHPLTDSMVREIRGVLALGPKTDWKVPIVKTEATEGAGVEELAQTIDAHHDHIAAAGTLEERRGRNLRNEVLGLATVRMRRELERSMRTDDRVRELLDRVVQARARPGQRGRARARVARVGRLIQPFVGPPDGGRFGAADPEEEMRRVVLAALAVALMSPGIADAAFPGANGRIAYDRCPWDQQMFACGGSDIWTMNADGSDELPLTSTPLRHEGWPGLVSRREKLAFFGYDGTRHSIYFTNPDGSGETRFPVDDARRRRVVARWDTACLLSRAALGSLADLRREPRRQRADAVEHGDRLPTISTRSPSGHRTGRGSSSTVVIITGS